MDAILSDPNFKIYGWSLADILYVQSWLDDQNATLKDLKDATLDRYYWSRKRIHQHLAEDFHKNV